MKKQVYSTIILAAIVILLATALSTFTQTQAGRAQFLSQLIYTGLENLHYNGRNVDKDFSEKAIKEFLDVLDPNKRFLLQKDAAELRRFKDKINEEFADGKTDLMTAATNRIQERIRDVMKFYGELLEKPFDFTIAEGVELDPEKRDYCVDIRELKEFWRKSLKYRTLLQYITLKENQEKEQTEKTKKKVKAKTDDQLEIEARKAVDKSTKNNLSRLLETFEKDGLTFYLNSLVQVYDPHSIYFPPLDKEAFDIQMSGSFEGIGALLREEDGYIKVNGIVPGGPSWKQKNPEPGDTILKVGQGDEEPEDIVGMRVEDAVKLIRGKKGTLVKLTIKKPDGQIEVVPLVRDVVVLEETFARSAIVSDKAMGKRFGYIFLPKFYNDFNHNNGRNSTDDVKKELNKLKSKKVDGIIIDLRNNSGGALLDAVRMSGLFIPEGPIVQVKDSRGDIQVLKDPDPEIDYSGPLTIMINSLSASASEIMAAALQDYERAVIVGSNQSFGKGTVQAMLNLDNYVTRKQSDGQSLGALTITIQKFYRINGASIQQKGVISDVVLPDQYSALDIGESYLPYSLSTDSVPPAEYTKWPINSVDLKLLDEKSKERTANEPRFKLLQDFIQKLKTMQDQSFQSLQLSKVMEEQKKLRKEREIFDQAEEASCHIKIEPSLEIVKASFTSGELFKVEEDRQKEWFKQIDTDVLLKETMAIMNDM
ncbi:MAG TPA: carboxy terminal-processing peptidase, partial [Candidatus Kapabacteria bacterium]|nr:carboxy terminal-processing peptidase [Candidatus Kapabacteria bacterium]